MSPVLRSCVLLVPALLALSGCKTNYIPNYADPPWDDEIRNRGDGLFLGVVVEQGLDGRREDGLRVERVLSGSPAASAGIQPGDVLLRLGAAPLRSAQDLAALLAKESSSPEWVQLCQLNAKIRAIREVVDALPLPEEGWATPLLTYDVTLQRGEQEEILSVTLVRAVDHADKAVAHLKKVSEDEKSGFWIPFVIDVTTERVSPEDWLAWFGRSVSEAPVLYRDIDLIPVLGLASLWRYESIPADGGRRMTIGNWPLRFTWVDEEGTYLESITEDGEGTRAIY